LADAIAFLRPLRPSHAFDAHHVYVRDADESEDRAKVGLLEIEFAARDLRIDAAAGDHDDGLFALEQAFGAFLAVGEGAPDARYGRSTLSGWRAVQSCTWEPRAQRHGCGKLVHQRVR